jgi:hypothetical protein
MFDCRQVDGKWFLVADMRLQCYTTEWLLVAAYAAFMCLLYVVGLPLVVLLILFRHRAHLFGDPTLDEEAKRIQFKYGFLYRCGKRNSAALLLVVNPPFLSLLPTQQHVPRPPATSLSFGCSAYGQGAWWWEVEELVRKLLLTSVVVLLDEGSALQVCPLHFR